MGNRISVAEALLPLFLTLCVSRSFSLSIPRCCTDSFSAVPYRINADTVGMAIYTVIITEWECVYRVVLMERLYPIYVSVFLFAHICCECKGRLPVMFQISDHHETIRTESIATCSHLNWSR